MARLQASQINDTAQKYLSQQSWQNGYDPDGRPMTDPTGAEFARLRTGVSDLVKRQFPAGGDSFDVAERLTELARQQNPTTREGLYTRRTLIELRGKVEPNFEDIKVARRTEGLEPDFTEIRKKIESDPQYGGQLGVVKEIFAKANDIRLREGKPLGAEGTRDVVGRVLQDDADPDSPSYDPNKADVESRLLGSRQFGTKGDIRVAAESIREQRLSMAREMLQTEEADLRPPKPSEPASKVAGASANGSGYIMATPGTARSTDPDATIPRIKPGMSLRPG